MMKSRRLSTFTRHTLGAVALAGATVLVGAGSATAAPLTTHTTSALGTVKMTLHKMSPQDLPYGCPLQYSCWYDGAPGFGKFYTASSVCQFINIGSMGMGDRVSSVFNAGYNYVRGYNWGASAGWIPVGDEVPPGYYANYTGAQNNIIDAIQVCT